MFNSPFNDFSLFRISNCVFDAIALFLETAKKKRNNRLTSKNISYEIRICGKLISSFSWYFMNEIMLIETVVYVVELGNYVLAICRQNVRWLFITFHGNFLGNVFLYQFNFLVNKRGNAIIYIIKTTPFSRS